MGAPEPGGALAITSHYFEFAPEHGGEPLPAWELEDGKRYQLIVSNSAGLYRYQLFDVIEVCGFHGRCPRIGFVHKTGAASNLVGEKLEESHVNDAVASALGAAEATFFTL